MYISIWKVINYLGVSTLTLRRWDEINIFEKAIILASSYKQTKIELKLINPFKTSSNHYHCDGKLRRSSGNWDISRCASCKVEVNTHFNAALHIRDGGVLA